MIRFRFLFISHKYKINSFLVVLLANAGCLLLWQNAVLFFSLLRAVVMIKNLLLWPLVGWMMGSRFKTGFSSPFRCPRTSFFICYSYQVRLSSAASRGWAVEDESLDGGEAAKKKQRREEEKKKPVTRHSRAEEMKLLNFIINGNRSSKTTSTKHTRERRELVLRASNSQRDAAKWNVIKMKYRDDSKDDANFMQNSRIFLVSLLKLESNGLEVL